MKVIINSVIPFKGFSAITFWPCIFVRKDKVEKLKKKGQWDLMLNHESIHGQQQKEVLTIAVVLAFVLLMAGCGYFSVLALPLYFWWYLLEWFVRLFCQRNAYRHISFEQEAYANEGHFDYIEERIPFAWVRYIFK